MPATVIHATRILTPDDEISDGVIVVEGSRITALGHRDEVRMPPGAIDYVATGMTVVPGFVDLHIHGAGGHDVMEATPGALSTINRELIGKAEALDSPPRVVLDMDSTEIPVYGQQENSAYNGHFESTCYHPLLLFNREGDCLAAKLRPGNVHSADDWEELLLPEIERQQKLDLKDGGWMYTDTHQEAKKEIPVKGLSEVWRILRQAGGHTRLREQHGSTSSGH